MRARMFGILLGLGLLLVSSGCSSRDERLAELAREIGALYLMLVLARLQACRELRLPYRALAAAPGEVAPRIKSYRDGTAFQQPT